MARPPLSLLFLAAVLALAPAAPAAPTEVPTIRSGAESITVRESTSPRDIGWRLAPEANPDEYAVDVMADGPTRVTFVTDVDSISFDVEVGDSHDFIIQWGEQVCHTRVTGRVFVPAAIYSQSFQEEHRGKILIEIPEVYELINVAVAATSFGQENGNFVYHDSPYHARVLERFVASPPHPFVATLDSLLTSNRGRYARLKMNGRAFEFDEDGKIVPSPVYDRTGFRGDRDNRLRPYLDQMQAFADATEFREFYRENAATYEEQITFYRDVADLDEMKRWLDERFPGSSGYDLYRIVFSPLVSYNQSSTWFENGGFRELQPHVNFPYPEDVNPSGQMSEVAETIYAGNIVFTEINHGYINPEADKYADRITAATSNRDHWVDPGQDANYYRGNATFNEYMNWGLVCLRIMDYVPEAEQEALIASVEAMSVHRHFTQFEGFNRRLMELYIGRGNDGTIADLYPAIIAWFEGEN